MANSINAYNVTLTYSNVPEFEYRAKQKLKYIWGHKGNFEDDRWICEGLKHYTHGRISKHTINFGSIIPEFRTIFKYFTLTLNVNPATVTSNVCHFNQFVEFLISQYNIKTPHNVNSKMVNEYQRSLLNQNNSATSNYKKVYVIKQFFDNMHEYLGIEQLTHLDKYNWLKIENDRKKDELYKEKILPPEFYIDLDRVFFDYQKEILVCIQLMYWLLRLIPSRIEEISLMKSSNQLRKFNDKYYLIIPLPKKSDQYSYIEQKILPLNGNSMVEEHLFNLIRKQIDISKALQNEPETEDKDFLFTTRGVCNKLNRGSEHPYLDGMKYSNRLVNIYGKEFNRHLKKIALQACKINDDFGNPKYSQIIKYENQISELVSSHKFRHRGITDRLDYGMKTHEIMFLSGLEVEETMWDSYHHPSRDTAIRPPQVYNPSEFKEDKLIRPNKSQTENTDIFSFEGESNYDDDSLDFEIKFYQHTPLVTNDGYRLGICHSALECIYYQEAINCIGCPNNLSTNVVEGGLEIIEQLIARFSDDMEFYSNEKKNKKMYEIAKANFEAYCRRRNQIINGVCK